MNPQFPCYNKKELILGGESSSNIHIGGEGTKGNTEIMD